MGRHGAQEKGPETPTGRLPGASAWWWSWGVRVGILKRGWSPLVPSHSLPSQLESDRLHHDAPRGPCR